jgi:hypothetical protein
MISPASCVPTHSTRHMHLGRKLPVDSETSTDVSLLASFALLLLFNITPILANCIPTAVQPNNLGMVSSPTVLVISKILLLIEEIRSTRAQIYDLWASISVLLKSCAFEAIESIGDTLSTAHDTLVLVISKATFIANPDKGCGANVGIADWAFAVAFIAETSDSNARLFAAHNKIRMMSRHDVEL